MRRPPGPIQFGGGGEPAQFICGYLSCDARLCRPVFTALPRAVLVSLRSDPGMDWLETSIRHAAGQALSPRPGGEGVLTKLSEVLLIETVRRHMEALPANQTGWFAGLRDPAVGCALAQMHQRPAHPWTVESLAREANVSRSVMAERFSHFVGQSPMNYLGKLRMAIGADLLRDGAQSVTRVAGQVGYETDAAFQPGLPPRVRPAAGRMAQGAVGCGCGGRRGAELKQRPIGSGSATPASRRAGARSSRRAALRALRQRSSPRCPGRP
jgi:AraC-like DNA-binding protein